MRSADASIPERVQIAPRWKVPVSVCPLPPDLYGQWRLDEAGNGQVFINARASKMQKHLTLFHELFHIAEDKLYLSGTINRRSTEDRVRHLTLTLFGIIATSGLWQGVSPSEARRFYAQMTRAYEAHRRAKKAPQRVQRAISPRAARTSRPGRVSRTRGR